MLVKNWLNYDHEKQVYEVNTQASLAEPDQALSVADIISRFTRGLPFQNVTTPVYNVDDEGNEIFPSNFDTLDISERMQMLQEARAYTEMLRKQEAEKDEVAPAVSAPQPLPDASGIDDSAN